MNEIKFQRVANSVNPAAGGYAYLGFYGNAANTVVYPLTVIALAIAVMIGDGCCRLRKTELNIYSEWGEGNTSPHSVIVFFYIIIRLTYLFS